MADKGIQSFIILVDISGYTGFLRENAEAIRHAQYIIGELMTALLDAAEPPLRPAKLEGDAVFFHTAEEPGSGEAVRRSLLAFFPAFYARRDSMIAANMCPCEACASLSRLDLKAVVHRGPVVSYELGGFHELAGYDIVIAHRLLKNAVEHRRYALVTEAAWPALAFGADTVAAVHVENIEGIGTVPARLLLSGIGGEEKAAAPPRASLPARLAEAVRKGLRSNLLARGLASRLRAADVARDRKMDDPG